MEFENIIKVRHATRKFKNEKIARDKLEKILEAGRLAPTAKNLQPIKIYVMESDEALEKIDKATPCRYGAQTVLLVCSDKEQSFNKNGHSTCEIDATIVAVHMMLEATNIDVQNIWIELFNREIIREEFFITDNLIPICLIPLGYEAEDCPTNPNHTVRKELTELVQYM